MTGFRLFLDRPEERSVFAHSHEGPIAVVERQLGRLLGYDEGDAAWTDAVERPGVPLAGAPAPASVLDDEQIARLAEERAEHLGQLARRYRALRRDFGAEASPKQYLRWFVAERRCERRLATLLRVAAVLRGGGWHER